MIDTVNPPVDRGRTDQHLLAVASKQRCKSGLGKRKHGVRLPAAAFSQASLLAWANGSTK
jgi:hypothetical protein